MYEHQLHVLERMVQHHKRAPPAEVTAVVGGGLATTATLRAAAAAATTDAAVAAAGETTLVRGHVSFITAAGTTQRVWVSPTVSVVGDSSAAVAVPTTRTTAAATTPTTAARVASTSAKAAASSPSPASLSSLSSSAASSTASSSSDAAHASKNGSSGIGSGAVAAIVIALLVALLAAGGFFFWRRKRNARLARGSGTGLIGDRTQDLGGAGGYKKQHETADSELFANSSASPMWGHSEKGTQQYGATDHDSYAGGVWPPPPPQSQQSQRESYNAPSFGSAVPYAAGGGNAWPSSSANLLGGAAVAGNAPRAMSPFADPHHDSIEQREMQQELENQRQQQALAAAAASPVVSAAGAGPFAESEGQGEIRIVEGQFGPSLEDELMFEPGDRVQVLMKYDDGWALGLNLSVGHPVPKGFFPFDCLGDIVPPPGPSDLRVPSPAGAAPLPGPVPSSLQPAQQPVDPANIPLPPPTPTGLGPIDEDTPPQLQQQPVVSASPPQLAPLALDRNDSPLSASFPPSVTHNGAPALAPEAQENKRASSLIASRDADLFVALGEVLEKKEETAAQVKRDEGESLI